MTGARSSLRSPQQLYEDWEGGQWSPLNIDLEADRRQWARIEPEERDLILFALSSLMVAEERITTQFTGLVMAYDSEEEATFLATQQVDEARHMQHYARVRNLVVGEPATITDHVQAARGRLSDAFRTIFDDHLVQAHLALVADPRDRAAKVVFVTTYHLIIEATLGLTSYEFLTRLLGQRGLLNGFLEGYAQIHRDERRHIAYGVWFLREAVRAQPDLADVLRATLRSLLPAVAGSLIPPAGGSARLPATTEEIRDFAISGLSRRLEIIGVPMDTL